MSITNASDLFRKLDEFKMRAEVEQRTEDTTVRLIAQWLRAQGEDKLAVGVEALEWYPEESRDENGKPRR